MENPKFIVTEDYLIIGYVEMHKDLASEGMEVLGGGWWHLDKENKNLYLYGQSFDYGRTNINKIRQIKESGLYAPSMNNFNWIFSESDSLNECMKNGELV